MGGASGPRRRWTKAQHSTSRSKERVSMIEYDIEILLVEDNPNDVELALDALREQKLANRIQVVRDGAEALDFLFRTGVYASRQNNFPKLVLLDLKLPKISGLEVLAHIRADPRTQALPVVV